MNEPNLILAVPTGNVTATSLGIGGLAQRRSPGSGKHFSGRSILVDLAADGEKPSFDYLEEGGWRDAYGDSVAAFAGVRSGSRTKTALSNSAFNCIPIAAYRSCHLVKTGGATMQLGEAIPLQSFTNHTCDENMTTEQVAQAIGQPSSGMRVPRLYMVISPIQFIMLSNLTPEEYAWYTTHRPGKILRQVMFTEIRDEQSHIAAQSRFTNARDELRENAMKKTKTIVFEDCLSRIPFQDWIGYRHEAQGGLYVGNRNCLKLFPFPTEIPHSWDKLEG
ncbi:MAG: hypothetical protein PHD54_06670 [Desulfuromonadaceae bacterium]|nr:hypothetical protein [Desulfuromonadaceae bacterium]